MSFFDLNNKNNTNTTDSITFDLPKMTIYKSEINQSTDTFNMLYESGTSVSNLISTIDNNTLKYTVSKLWLCQYTNKIGSNTAKNGTNPTTDPTTNPTTNPTATAEPKVEDYVGELVVELLTSNFNNKAFACFLLQKSTSSVSNCINQIMELSKSGTYSDEMDLNEDIPKQNKCIVYISKDMKDYPVKVFVFTNPILVNPKYIENIKTFSPPFDTTLSTIQYKIVTSIEEESSDEIYIDCQPTGETPESIAAYVPVNSINKTATAESEYMTAASHFFTFSIGLALCYFVVPIVYKFSVIDRINETSNTEWDRTSQLQASDMLISIIVAYAVIYLTIHGYKIQSNSMKMMSIIVAIFFILSFTIVQIKKTYPSFMTTIIANNPVQISLTDLKFENIKLIPGIIWEWFAKIGNNLDKIIVFELFYVILMLFLYYSDVFDMVSLIVFLTVINLNFILLVCLFIIIVYKQKLSKVLEIAQQQLTQ